MSLDLTTLRLLKYRDKYDRLFKAVPSRAMDTRTRILLDDFGRWFKEHPEAPRIDAGSFSLFFKLIHPSINDDDRAVYDAVFKKVVEEDVDPKVEPGIRQRLEAAAAGYDLAVIIQRFSDGEEVDLRAETGAILEQYDKNIDRKVKNPQVLDPIEDLLKQEEDDRGFHWRLACLNRHIKPLVAGDFVVVAARPDKGKTTFAASELTFMAGQVDTLFPNERRSILWFNNEGPGRRIVTRCFQAALNATIEQLVSKSNAGTIRKEYAEAMGGRGGTLRIFDVHGMNNTEIEDLIKLHRPALVLWDMIDNVNFVGLSNNNGQRTDQLLEAMYQWVRMMGVKYECAQMATSQISAAGDGQTFPTLPMLKDSQTGKQGAADVIITLGALNDEMLINSRYIGTTKNKKVRTGVPASPRAEVLFDGDRGRYVELA